ncbi:hypothetical protein BUB20358_06138 [Burkholderia ubonensis]|nr:hypothetical protein BUB20358_06138 [Burkholderia ubonensis]
MHVERRRHHVAGQAFAQVVPHRFDVERRVGGRQMRVEPPLRALAVRDDRRIADARRGAQHGLDFAELDAESADLDLLVGAPEEIERAVRAQAHEIAGPIEPRARLA